MISSIEQQSIVLHDDEVAIVKNMLENIDVITKFSMPIHNVITQGMVTLWNMHPDKTEVLKTIRVLIESYSIMMSNIWAYQGAMVALIVKCSWESAEILREQIFTTLFEMMS